MPVIELFHQDVLRVSVEEPKHLSVDFSAPCTDEGTVIYQNVRRCVSFAIDAILVEWVFEPLQKVLVELLGLVQF